MTNDKWNDDNKGVRHLANPPVAWSRAKYDQIQDRWALPLGGPFWKDHLWFFGAYEWYDQTSPFSQTATTTNPVTTGTGQSYQQTLNVKLYDGKLTLQATPSHLLTGTINSDPITGFAVDYWGQFGLPAAERRALTLQGQNDCGGICTWSGRWSGVFGSNISAEALYAQQKSDITVTNFEGNGSPYINLTDGLVYNGGAFDGFVRRPRKQGNLAVNLYQQLFGNSHQFKVGVDYQDLQSIASFIYPGNQEFVVTNYDPVTRQPVLSPGDQRLDFTTPQASTSTGKIWGFYALDKFEVGKNLFFNVGFRHPSDLPEVERSHRRPASLHERQQDHGSRELRERAQALLQGDRGHVRQALFPELAGVHELHALPGGGERLQRLLVAALRLC